MKQLYGLIGEKLSHSMSPIIHNKIFKELELDGDYRLFEIKKSELYSKFIDIKNSGAKGLNVTIPYKITTMDFVDELSTEAKNIGAINTICFKCGKTTGHNTDYHGFGNMLLKNDIDPSHKTAVVLGAGGAAKAVVQYLIDKNAKEIFLVSRDPIKASKTFKNVSIINYTGLDNLKRGDIIINCTPLGMFPNINNCAVDNNCISKFSYAVDLIYNPSETLFLKNAKKLGLQAVNGLYMLISQAVCAQELWHDVKISDSVTDKIYSDLLEKYKGE
ncbi:MAG: shikimate dehydrogenase [Clostridium sp.]|nr:shikimate dehydrogenase [Clostridium sp.]